MTTAMSASTRPTISSLAMLRCAVELRQRPPPYAEQQYLSHLQSSLYMKSIMKYSAANLSLCDSPESLRCRYSHKKENRELHPSCIQAASTAIGSRPEDRPTLTPPPSPTRNTPSGRPGQQPGTGFRSRVQVLGSGPGPGLRAESGHTLVFGADYCRLPIS